MHEFLLEQNHSAIAEAVPTYKPLNQDGGPSSMNRSTSGGKILIHNLPDLLRYLVIALLADSIWQSFILFGSNVFKA